MKLENLGSLITYKDKDGADRCLGYLMYFEGKGVYDAALGRVEVLADEAQKHNHLLDEASLKGLDENCAIGQGGTFYYRLAHGGRSVITWLGTEVAAGVCVRVAGNVITFRRGKKLYRGRLRKDGDAFNFRRVA